MVVRETSKKDDFVIEEIDKSKADRQKRIDGWDQDLVEKAKIVIVGAGALGNEIIKNYALIGIKKIILIDFDTIVPSNLNRCIFFRETDSAKPTYKVDAILKRISTIEKNCRIIPIIAKLEDVDPIIFDDIDLVVSALDNFAARSLINQICWERKIPLVDGGMHGFYGMVRVVIPRDTPCINCTLTNWGEMFKIDNKDPCTGQKSEVLEEKIPAIATMSSIIGAIQVQESLKIIHGIHQYRKEKTWSTLGAPMAGKMAYFDAFNNSFNIYEIPKNEDCPTCSPLNGMYED